MLCKAITSYFLFFAFFFSLFTVCFAMTSTFSDWYWSDGGEHELHWECEPVSCQQNILLRQQVAKLREMCWMIDNRNYLNKCPLLTVLEINISKTSLCCFYVSCVSPAVLNGRGLVSNVLVSPLSSWLSLRFQF